MKIIEQSYEILSLPENANKLIEMAGRTCYKSEDKITDDSSENFVKMLINHGHNAMIEFSDITVKFITNRGVTHELVRHRMCSFAQESTRYVKYNGDMEFIKPVWFNDSDIETKYKFDSILMECEKYYKILLEDGWQAQQAREVLPNALKTEIVCKANIREWRHIFNLRCSKKAHPQIRELMIPLLNDLKEKMPIIFDDINYV